MRVQLEYGRTGLEIELPDANVVNVLGYRSGEPLADPEAAVAERLARPKGTRPLAELARGRRSACVVISCDNSSCSDASSTCRCKSARLLPT